MAGSEIIVLSDIVKRDLYCHENIDDAIAELMDLAANLNRSNLYFAWTVGKFAENRKLKTQYGIENHAQLAKLMGTSDMSITRYCNVFKLLTEEQLRQFGNLRISTNAVLEIATAHSNGYKEEAKQLIDLVLSNEISTAVEIKSSFKQMLMEKSRPYNLLPGGEAPPVVEGETLEVDAQEAEESVVSPADTLVQRENLDEQPSAVADEDEDDSVEDTSDDSESLSKKDAVMMLKTVRQQIAAMRRDMVQIWRDLQAEVDSVIEAQSVILGDAASSAEFDELMSSVYLDMQEATKVLIEQLARGAEFGYVEHQVAMPKAGRRAFCGCGLFREDQ